MSEITKSRTPIVDQEVDFINEAYEKNWCLDEHPMVRARIARQLEREAGRLSHRVTELMRICLQAQLKLDEVKNIT